MSRTSSTGAEGPAFHDDAKKLEKKNAEPVMRIPKFRPNKAIRQSFLTFLFEKAVSGVYRIELASRRHARPPLLRNRISFGNHSLGEMRVGKAMRHNEALPLCSVSREG